MKKHLQNLLPIAVAIGLTSVGMSKMAWAAQDSSSFDSTIQVLPFCSISTSDLNFGTISAGVISSVDASTTLNVDCSNNTNYSVALSNGANFDSTRRMAWGGNFIRYALYSDPSRNTEWNSNQTVSGTGNGSTRIHTIYGRVISGQTVSNPGSYGDTIVATISY
jgi:spore coat protein U-like protein